MSEMFSDATMFNGDISLAVGCIRAMVIYILIINLIMIHILFYNLYINLIGMIINHPIGRFTIVPSDENIRLMKTSYDMVLVSLMRRFKNVLIDDFI